MYAFLIVKYTTVSHIKSTSIEILMRIFFLFLQEPVLMMLFIDGTTKGDKTVGLKVKCILTENVVTSIHVIHNSRAHILCQVVEGVSISNLPVQLFPH
jgi:hypothetical protein